MSANMQLEDWKHWRLRRKTPASPGCHLDKADASANTLSAEVMSELAGVLDALDAAPPKAW
jgi:3-hydroxyacyl-CoA dehydrogenase/enoyl-CoA hydratase/3-hydroxybutyryl-CoA epimerase